MQYAMQADTGLAHGMYFVESCCSKTIVKDVRHLKNITLLAAPAKVAGLTGITEIQHKADLYMPVEDVRGKQTTIVLKRVYYDPTIKYNLISVAELANVSYKSRFGQHKISIKGPVGIVPFVQISNVYGGIVPFVQICMIDMSKIPTITGKQYCTMIMERKTRVPHFVLHDSKSEETIIQIFTRVLPLLTEMPIIVKSDCAPEYHTPKMEVIHKDVHGVKEN